MIFVDQPTTWNKRFTNYCHMWSDANDLVELQAFAAKIGLNPDWFQGQHAAFPHFDISQGKRQQALKFGAVEKPLGEWIMEQKAKKVSNA